MVSVHLDTNNTVSKDIILSLTIPNKIHNIGNTQYIFLKINCITEVYLSNCILPPFQIIVCLLFSSKFDHPSY
jgi:hypothetical protein